MKRHCRLHACSLILLLAACFVLLTANVYAEDSSAESADSQNTDAVSTVQDTENTDSISDQEDTDADTDSESADTEQDETQNGEEAAVPEAGEDTDIGGGNEIENTTPPVTVKLDTVKHGKYMNGSSDGLFHARSALTRAEAANIIYSLITGATEDDVQQHVTFTDVDSSDWYYKAVSALASYGVMNGNDGKFRPNAYITRAEFVATLARFSEKSEAGSSFSDVPESHWAYDDIMSAAAAGWLTGYEDGTFRPDSTVSRAEAAAIINRCLGRIPDKSTIGSASGIRIFPDLDSWYWAYKDIMEASISHEYTSDGTSESWTSFTHEKTVLSPGTHLINGVLYLVDSNTNDFVVSKYVDGHWYDYTGKYTTGNTTLDSLMREATKACTNSNMTKHQMLKSAFNYVINNFTYLSKSKQSTGATGWTESYAVPMFQTHKGNCYSFASVYYYLAKNIGYNPTEVAGLVGHNRRPHGWIEIKQNGTTYIYDTELTMAKRAAGYHYYLFEMTYSNASFVYSKK